MQVKEGIVGRMRSGVPGSLSPLRPPTRTRPHGPPHPSRARESKVSTAGENRMILKTDREIREPEHPKAALCCDAIGLKRHCHNMTISKG